MFAKCYDEQVNKCDHVAHMTIIAMKEYEVCFFESEMITNSIFAILKG